MYIDVTDNDRKKINEINLRNGSAEGSIRSINSKALGPNTASIGTENIAGGYGYNYRAIDLVNKKIYLTAIKVTDASSIDFGEGSCYSESLDTGYAVGDKFSLVNDLHFDLCGTITNINGNEITYSQEEGKEFTFTSIESDDGQSGYSFYVPSKPTVGTISLFDSSNTAGISNKSVGRAAHSEGRQNLSAGDYAHTEGRNNIAVYAAHAEGLNTQALGHRSHTENLNTIASGEGAHAEGRYTKAIGNFSHSEGDNTQAIGHVSHSEGFNTQAMGPYAHAEGEQTEARGWFSHAEGLQTKSIGNCSHTEGNGTQASGNSSHAEGVSTKALDAFSHAEGNSTTASAEASHAEGRKTTASGMVSHAEGNSTTASGVVSHAEGHKTTAGGDYSHAEGSGTTAGGNYSHAEGYNTTAGQMGFKVTACEKLTDTTGTYTLASVTGLSTGLSYSVHLSSSKENCGQITAIDTTNKKITVDGYPDIALSSSSSSTTNYLTIVNKPNLGDILISGEASHAEGNGTKASGYASHAEGGNTKASGVNSHAEGQNTKASGPSSHAEGYITTASNYYSHAEGFYTTASACGAHAEGANTTASGNHSHVEGFYTKASGEDSHAEGHNTTASGNSSHAEGEYTTASGYASHAEGLRSTASAYSHAEGVSTKASGYCSHAEGVRTKASSECQHVQGEYNIEDKDNTYADIIGNGSSDTERSNATTVDWQGNAWYAGDVYVGSTSGKNKDDGSKKLATEDYVNSAISSSGGSGSNVQADWQQNDETANDYVKNRPGGYIDNDTIVKIPEKYLDIKNTNIVNGSKTGSLRTVGSTEESSEESSKYTLGDYAFAEGYATKASGYCSHAEGYETKASGDDSHAEGIGTTASGNYSHAEGNNTVAGQRGFTVTACEKLTDTTGTYTLTSITGLYKNLRYSVHLSSSKENCGKITAIDTTNKKITVDGYPDIALDSGFLNYLTIVNRPELGDILISGEASHAEGGSTKASGDYSHAEGGNTKASGDYSHAEGIGTTASGRCSHAEGVGTEASGDYSHAEGFYTTASGNYSHAEGYNTTASSSYQHVQGQYNIEDYSYTYADIIGNGAADGNRSNAATVDWYGNAWYAGAVTSKAADYAEFFEWLDGNPDNEDRVGYLVALDGEKIRFANPGDEILGIISANPAVLGDNYECDWNGKYLTDEFGRILYDKVEEFIDIPKVDEETGETTIEKKSLGFFDHPRINPDYDPNQEYINRRNRSEWAMVGMLGKLFVRDDGTAQINGYVSAGEDGIATASTEKTNMRVLSRVNDHIVKVLLK